MGSDTPNDDVVETQVNAPESAPKKKAATAPKKKTVKKAATKKAAKKSATKKAAKKSAPKKATRKDDKGEGTKKRKARLFPAVAFEQAKKLGEAIVKFAPGEVKVRRLTILDKLDLTETSKHAQNLITNSGQYGITRGGYTAEWLNLTNEGQAACSPDEPKSERVRAAFTLAIEGIAPFKTLYDEYAGKRLPAHEFIFDFLDTSTDFELEEDKSECVDLFITNVKDLGLLRTIGGAGTLITLDHLLDEYVKDDGGESPLMLDPSTPPARLPATPKGNGAVDWETACFYVTPIGKPGSVERKHSDLFKTSIVEPAVKELGLKVYRADEVETAGMITSSIIEFLRRSKLVIADLSMRNPNVYYEIALRHACRLPIVQIRREGEEIPFDINQLNTITIDNTDLYTFVPQIETFQSQVTTLARAALQDPSGVSNPVTTFYPQFFD
ncbi:hypothetical protein AB1L30_01540 [Bremerella sp. JC817]|uniref:hypothetical protein n=1 Tax=Bremerella sp. JC817 TaxID=3231756 RepID=UPI0034598A32